MAHLDSFDKQLKEHDLPLLFDFNRNNGDKVLKDALTMAEKIFKPYAHLLMDSDGGWIAKNWRTGDSYGYRLCDLANGGKPPRTPLDYDKCLVALDKPNSGQIDRNTCMYLFTSRPGHWSISMRSGSGIKSVIGFGSGGWSALEADPDTLAARFKEAINAISAFRSEKDNCAEFFNEVIKTRNWTGDPDTTVLFHLVWPQFYPVWYRGTKDGYSQIPGMDKLLDALGTELDLARRPINFPGNYEQYASAYRVLLRLYHQFVYKDEQKPRETPHFDYFTLLLAELDPCREALCMLLDRKALVLYGVPGTGKTYTALKELAPALAESTKECNHIATVQFHPGYSYADFIIGIRPRSDGNGVTYPVEAGVLYRLAAEAALALEEAGGAKAFGDGTPILQQDADDGSADVRKKLRFVLVIDEINRADLAKVLGEAMLQLEYRGEQHKATLPLRMPNDTKIISVLTDKPLPHDPFHGGQSFYIPQNLYIIGTMNNADRSISGFDMALRRRFAWAEHGFSPASLREMLKERCKLNAESVGELTLTNMEAYIDRCRKLNTIIETARSSEQGGPHLPFNRDHVVGHTYFAEIVSIVRQSGQKTCIAPSHLAMLWLYYLAPLLEDFLSYEVHQYRDALKELREEFISKL